VVYSLGHGLPLDALLPQLAPRRAGPLRSHVGAPSIQPSRGHCLQPRSAGNLFVLMRWFKQQKLGSLSMLRDMALVFGFEVQLEFLTLWESEVGDPNS